MKSQNGGSPSKTIDRPQVTAETSVLVAVAALERRRIPCFITKRPFSSEAHPNERATTPNQSGKSAPVP